MAAIPVEIGRSVSKGAGDSFIDRILSTGKTVVKGAGDVVRGVLADEKVQKFEDALIDVFVAKQAAKIQRDQSRERPEAAQAGAGGGPGAPASASITSPGQTPFGSGLSLPLAIGLGALVLVGVVFALRR